jgi:ribose 5-phosphate isomerase B
MTVALGCDHAGFPLKARIREAIEASGETVLDCGVDSADPPVDYPDCARKVGAAIVHGQAERGILLCGSGVGIAVAANKIPGIRAAVCHDTYSAHQGVEHDAMNVLCLGARVIGEELAAELTRTFLAARFSGEERHVRRLEKTLEIERTSLKGEAGP